MLFRSVVAPTPPSEPPTFTNILDTGFLKANSLITSDQRTAGLDAALGHARDDGRHPLRDVLAHGDVVQEEQGPRAAAQNVVDAHGHAVDADGVVPARQKGF